MFSEEIIRIFNNHKNSGRITKPEAVGEIGSAECGEIVTMYARIDAEGVIEQVKFQAFGNFVLIAASSIIAKMLEDMQIDEIADIELEEVLESLGDVGEQYIPSVSIALECANKMVVDYKKRQIKLEKKLNKKEED